MNIELTEETKKILDSSDEERIKYINEEYWIDYPIAQNILEKMEDIYNFGYGKTRYISILLVGGSNNGKTSLLKQFLEKHPPYDYNIDGEQPDWITDDFFDKYTGIGRPVLYVISPTEPSESRLYSIILEQLNIPYKTRDSLDVKAKLVEYYLKALNVRVLIIDEIHNILNGSPARQKQIMSAIRDLSSKLTMPVILAGVKEALRAVNTEDQISSRYRPEYLTKWKMDKDYISLLATTISKLPLKKQSTIINKDDAQEILELCNGYIGEIVNLIKAAAVYAIKTGSERVTINEIKECGFNTLQNIHKTMNLKDI
ncbi:TniB [Sulfurimonas denitrificans DSM 1251]|uniref:TniB n=1 Tax=Sulfurimonas denitrificans (strain ATCC 33889 / DSM 1251) TaxID=326298 RepID=Q30Q63_SULDN|nr:TniB family NTP-binding protein [Sulfurimonas denitrificans]ABB43973.1 TniB [Sulfurimonas denitrificans DSM 1251]ABB44868.1 TniB [Sulfurimonas denitrificans DSM 1251]